MLMKISQYSIFLIVLFGFTIGTVWASQTFEFDEDPINGTSPVTVKDGNLKVINANLLVEKLNSSTSPTIMIKGDNKYKLLRFWDTSGTDTKYDIYMNEFETRMYFKKTEPPPGRVDMTINIDNGNIGFGTLSPSQKMDLVGNFQLSGDIIGVSGMTIDPNGDLCLGSGC